MCKGNQVEEAGPGHSGQKDPPVCPDAREAVQNGLIAEVTDPNDSFDLSVALETLGFSEKDVLLGIACIRKQTPRL